MNFHLGQLTIQLGGGRLLELVAEWARLFEDKPRSRESSLGIFSKAEAVAWLQTCLDGSAPTFVHAESP